MSGPLRERLAVVQCAGRQGSGYLLTPWLVLTAAHVVAGAGPRGAGDGTGSAGDDGNVHVTVPGGRAALRCERVGSWHSEQPALDIALLRSEEPLTGLGFSGSDRTRWARFSSLGPVPGCQAIGFPYVQRAPGGLLDTEQLTGTYKPGSGMVSGRDALVVDGTPPASRTAGISPWAGMSGAAVFAGGVLIGVVSGDPAGWQHGRLTVSPLQRMLDEQDFLAVLDEHDYRVFSRLTGPPGQLTDGTAVFESRYAAHLAQRHGTLRIFGIDLTDRRRATWPLDAAYYSLEAVEREGAWPMSPVRAGGPLPAEQALAGHARVLLRGVAGSGKTTLVQWLAVSTARQELGEHMAHLRDLVPYVLPLRTIGRRDRLPAPADFLTAVDAPLTAPLGWAEQVLTEGRALVLVDGLDEVDERTRERVGGWLRDLLAVYPGNRWLVTARPAAVADSWLAEAGFAELTLSPMGRRDVTAFTGRWHDAARATLPPGDTEERARLDRYQRSLLDALHTKQDLARLATNPLMCGLICALHRDRAGYLPTGRKELYDAALSMLLIRRDRERDLGGRLTEEPQIQLLQKLAYWLVKNGQAEMDTADAQRLITGALPAMPSVRAELGGAAEVYRHLLERSGLLREPAAGTVDFVHRTFQDYLAARAAVEDLDFDLLAQHAHLDQWADVIRMAVAHGRPAERARLLRAIIERGDRDPDLGARLHLLAMACLEHATELDPQVRAAVEERTERLIPPQTTEDAHVLAAVGPLVLELLPGPEGLSDPECMAVILTARQLGVDASVPVLYKYVEHPSTAIRNTLAGFDRGIDPDLYLAEVLSALPRAETMFSADTVEELARLASLGGIRHLLTHMAPSSVLQRALARFAALEHLSLAHAEGQRIDLTNLVGLPRLTRVDVHGSSKVFNADKLPHVKVVYY